MALELRRIVLELNRLACQRHLAVPPHPGWIIAGQDFAHETADHGFSLQASEPLESGIHLQEAVITRLTPLVAHDLVQGKSFRHLLEERPIACLTLAQRRLQRQAPHAELRVPRRRLRACKRRSGTARCDPPR